MSFQLDFTSPERGEYQHGRLLAAERAENISQKEVAWDLVFILKMRKNPPNRGSQNGCDRIRTCETLTFWLQVQRDTTEPQIAAAEATANLCYCSYPWP